MDGILSGMGLFSEKKATSRSQPKQEPTPQVNSEPLVDNSVNASTHTSSSTEYDLTERSADMKNSSISPINTTTNTTDDSPNAVIGSKISFKGELSGDEDLLIQGTVEGTVNLKGNQLTIGKLGRVKANLTAKNIIVDGNVEGDLIAEEHIAINTSSIVTGNVKTNRMTLQDGATFRGSIDMDIESSNKASSKSTASSYSSSRFDSDTKSETAEEIELDSIS